MFFSGDDDESDFVSPSGNSKLASLFGTETSGNESLTYTAPKQPKKVKEQSESNGATAAVLCASALHVYKLIDGKYASQGKLGCALFGTHSTADYKVLLYKTKQQPVANAKVHSEFRFSVQDNNYASFYDDLQQNWSICFDNQQQLENFAKQVCVCKYICSGTSSEHQVVSQDLYSGEGGGLENGDAAEVKYTGWLLANNGFGAEFDSNSNADKLLRFKLGKGKILKGWEEGMAGMKKGGKRLIVVPPSLGYGEKGSGAKVPPGSTLIFHVEVIRVKLAKEKDQTPSGRDSPASVTTELTSQEPVSEDESGVKARTRSISEQLEQKPVKPNKSDKAHLISRMAKMGKPMLPMNMKDKDNSEDGDVVNTPVCPTDSRPSPSVSAEPVAAPNIQFIPQAAPHNTSLGYPPDLQQQPMMASHIPATMINPATHAAFSGTPASQIAVYQSPQQYPQFQTPAYQQMYPSHPQMPPVPSNNTDSNLPVLITESRTHNTEMRIAISKMQDRIDHMSQRIEHAYGGNMGMTPTMESSILLHNIQRIVQENERIKKELFERSAKVESQNERIAELLRKNQQYVEQSHVLLEEKSIALTSSAANTQNKVLVLEQEKVQLATDLSAATAQMTKLQLEVTSLHKKEAELQRHLEKASGQSSESNMHISELKLQNSELQDQVNELTISVKNERLAKRSAEGSLSTTKEELSEIKASNSSLEVALKDRKKKKVPTATLR